MTKRHHTNPEYIQYINSKKWKAKRQEAFNARGRCCEMCGSKEELHVHHVSYKRFGGKELMSDLCILCKPCHMEVHSVTGKRNAKPKKNQPYYRRIAIRELGIKRKGSNGWIGLARSIASKLNEKSMFSNKDHAKRYAKDRLSKFEQCR